MKKVIKGLVAEFSHFVFRMLVKRLGIGDGGWVWVLTMYFWIVNYVIYKRMKDPPNDSWPE